MELSITERLVLLSLLPEQGNLTTLKLVMSLRNVLGFDEKEHAALNFKEDNGMTVWDTSGEKSKEIQFAPRAFTIVSDILDKMDKEKKLTVDHLSLCDKFLKDEENVVALDDARTG